MTKDDLSKSLSKKTGLSKNMAEEAVNIVLEEITKSLSKGEIVSLTGFGKFEVRELKERVGVNPRTGEKIKIPSTKSPKFKPGKILKDMVR